MNEFMHGTRPYLIAAIGWIGACLLCGCGGKPVATFAELGIPFPLFEAPVTEAGEYVGRSNCTLCGARGRHCFRLDIGCSVVVPCPACGVENGLDASDREDIRCRSCEAKVPFPDYPKDEDIHICYQCLRAGKGAITKDTELGMVSWEQAVEGITHGMQGLESGDFELVPVQPESGWYGARVPSEHLFELVRTPTYTTWQGESWLFCCKQPMTYLGEWQHVVKSPHSPADPRGLFDREIDVCDDPDFKEWLWERISAGSETECVYVFRCRSCNKLRVNWDME